MPPLPLLLALTIQATAPSEVVVHDSGQLRVALGSARPGTTVRVAAGEYEGGTFISGISGTADAPIVLAGDPTSPPVIRGRQTGLQLAGCSHVVVRDLAFAGQEFNALNIDDGGGDGSRPAIDIRVERLSLRDVGADGITNLVKLSGVDGFVVSDCTFEGWGGSAIDMVGCHDGKVEACRFKGKGGFRQNSGVQVKGGSAHVKVLRCRFDHAGPRPVNAGGQTGEAFFRPRGAACEASDVTVERNVFVGGETPIAFTGLDGGAFRFNTVVRPERWLFRAVQESTGPRFVPCRNVEVSHNLFVWSGGTPGTAINVGERVAADTFRVSDNLFFREDAPRRSEPVLPGKGTGNLFGQDPKLDAEARPGAKAAAGFGAGASS